MAVKKVTRRKKPVVKKTEPVADVTLSAEAEVSAKVEATEIPGKAEFLESESDADLENAANFASELAEAKPAQPAQLPKVLQDRIAAMAGIQDDLSTEIAKFKSGEAYLEGDIPITLHGLGGPGFNLGQRSLNWLNPDWLDPVLHFRWSNKSMVDYHRSTGYTPCDYDEFTRMVVARGGGHSFTKSPEGHVVSGDLVMVQVSKDWYDKLAADVRKRTAGKEGRAKNNVYAKGDSLGVDVYEGSEAVSPKMDGLLKFLERELGPGAVDAYLGR